MPRIWTRALADRWRARIIKEGFFGRVDRLCTCEHQQWAHPFELVDPARDHFWVAHDFGRCFVPGCGCMRFAMPVVDDPDAWWKLRNRFHELAAMEARDGEPVTERDPETLEQWLALMARVEGRDLDAGGGSKGRRVQDRRSPSAADLREKHRRNTAEDEVGGLNQDNKKRVWIDRDDDEVLRRHGIRPHEIARTVAERLREEESTQREGARLRET